MFYMFDPLYLLLIGPALILSVGAQLWVKSAFAKYSSMGNRQGLSGAEAARKILNAEGIFDVRIERARGFLSDHYDPREKVLRLSEDVYSNASLASVGVAAHEAGHAMQDAQRYAALKFRSAIVPTAQIGSSAAMPLLFIGLFFNIAMLAKLGVILFAAVVLFQIVTLPVEFNASRRALAALSNSGVLARDEMSGARQVLTAAALTYVAAAVAAVMQLIYFLIRSGLLGGRDD